MKREEARRLLERMGFVRHPCDLDLLRFFVRHPRSLVTSEHIASFLGYDLKRVGESLEVLIAANVLTRSQSSAHAARLYVFAPGGPGGPGGGWLPSVIEAMSTREGRLALREGIGPPPGEGARRSLQRSGEGLSTAAERSRRK
jgi:hypothetical protein